MPSLLLDLLVPGPPDDRRSSRRNALADLAAVGAALVYGASMVRVGDASAPGAALPWQVDLAIGTACALPLFVRRRWPLGVALTLLPFGTISVMATGAILVAFFTAAIRLAPRIVLALGAVHVAGGAIYFLLQDHTAYPFWVDLLARSVTGFGAIGWGLFVQAYRELTRSLRVQARTAESEQHMRVQSARIAERTRIAREMHDVLAHRMSLVSLYAGALEVRTDARPEEVAAAAAAIRGGVHEALQELRTVIGVLRAGAPGPPEPPQPGLADLPDLLDSARSGGMTIDFTCRVDVGAPSSVLGRTAYRLVQEGLTNARKHAPGAAVEVLLEGAVGADLRVRVTNPVTDRSTNTNLDPRTDPSPERRTAPTPSRQTDRHPGRQTDPGPGQQTDPSPNRQTDPGPRRQTDPSPRRQTDPSPRRQTDPSPNRQTDPHPGRAAESSAPRRPAWQAPRVADEPAPPGSGMGLLGVGERVALAGGRVEYGPECDRFRLEAWLPWPA